MPQIVSQQNSKATTPTKTPIFNPPTPFANTPSSFPTFDSRRTILEIESSKNAAVQTLFRVDDSDDSDSEESTEMAPRSLRSPMTTPTFPSLIQDSISTLTVSKKQQDQTLSQLFSQTYNSNLSQNVLQTVNSSTQQNHEEDLTSKVSQKFKDSKSLPEKSDDKLPSKIPLFNLQSPLKDSDPAFSNPSRFDPPTFRSNVDNDPSFASSLQESVSIKIPEDRKVDDSHRLEAAIRYHKILLISKRFQQLFSKFGSNRKLTKKIFVRLNNVKLLHFGT